LGFKDLRIYDLRIYDLRIYDLGFKDWDLRIGLQSKFYNLKSKITLAGLPAGTQ
jgi:hypothetical protein